MTILIMVMMTTVIVVVIPSNHQLHLRLWVEEKDSGLPHQQQRPRHAAIDRVQIPPVLPGHEVCICYKPIHTHRSHSSSLVVEVRSDLCQMLYRNCQDGCAYNAGESPSLTKMGTIGESLRSTAVLVSRPPHNSPLEGIVVPQPLITKSTIATVQ